MNRLQGTLIILGIFILRVGVPLMITFVIGHLLRRLEAKWQVKKTN